MPITQFLPVLQVTLKDFRKDSSDLKLYYRASDGDGHFMSHVMHVYIVCVYILQYVYCYVRIERQYSDLELLQQQQRLRLKTLEILCTYVCCAEVTTIKVEITLLVVGIDELGREMA